MNKRQYISPEVEIEKFGKITVFTASQDPDFDGSGDSGDTEF